MIALLIATTAVVAGSWHTAALLRLRRGAESAVAWLVFALAQSSVTVLALGLAHLLRPAALLPATLLLSLGQCGYAWARPAQRAVVRAHAARQRALVLRAVRAVPRHPLIVTLGILVAAEYVWRGALATYLPTVDGDSLAYHLLGPDVWVQAHAIVHSPQNLFSDVYPDDQGLLVAFAASFLHTMRGAWLVQIPFTLLGTGAVAGLARLLGAKPAHAVLGALLFAATPAAFIEFGTPMNDLGEAATVLAAFFLALSYWYASSTETRPADLVVRYLVPTGAAAGLAAGIKSSGMLALVLIGVALLLLVYRQTVTRDADRSLNATATAPAITPAPADAANRALRLAALAFFAPALACAAFWYARTWIAYGNPFYPISMLGFAGRGPADEVLGLGAAQNMPLELRTVPFGWFGQAVRSWMDDLGPRTYDSAPATGGFGLVWVPIVLPAAVLGLVRLARTPRRMAAGCIVLLIIAWLAASPAAWYPRMNLIVPALAASLAAYTLSTVRLPHRAGLIAVATAGMVALTLLWATTPTYYQQVTADGHVRTLNARQAFDMMTGGPSARASLYPLAGYSALRMVPTGATIATTWSGGPQPFTHPLIGERLTHHLAQLGYPATADELRDQMSAAGAGYVILGGNGADPDLLASVAHDGTRFKELTYGGVMMGGDLYQLGTFRRCADVVPTLTLAAAAAQHQGGTAAVQVTTTCGTPVAGDSVSLYERHGTTDVRVSTARLDARGRAALRLPRVAEPTLVFARTSGAADYNPTASTPWYLTN